MALENVVFQQDPFINYSCNDFYSSGLGFNDEQEEEEKAVKPGRNLEKNTEQILANTTDSYWDSSSPGDGAVAGGSHSESAPAFTQGRRKRRRTRSLKNKEERENQRMTHIAIERNRRKQMNDYLAVLRSLMPPSYSQRGDQASIVGGAINFVKELEQFVQFLESQNQNFNPGGNCCTNNHLFANFFTFPQYSTHGSSRLHNPDSVPSHESTGAKKTASVVADVEVAMVETHANIKILSRKQPKQLIKLVAGFCSLGLSVLHLNAVTTLDHMALYSFSVKVEDDCHFGTVNEVATIVHEMMAKIQEEAMSS